MSRPDSLTARDEAQLAAAGIARDEARRQLRLLEAPPPAVRLLRPATPGDGIESIAPEREDSLIARARTAQFAGRFEKFVPASGAATRMFRALHAAADRFGDERSPTLREAAAAGDRDASEAVRTLEALPATAVGVEMARLAGDRPLFAWLLSPAGRAFASLPKGLLPFHAGAGGSRTAFAEQIHEGAAYLADGSGAARFHFTIPEGTQELFERELRDTRVEATDVAVRFSEQLAATHALALDAHGQPARSSTGELLLRPSGHGALLSNLGLAAANGADLLFVKNIDNVLPASRHGAVARWKGILAGRLLELEAERRDRARPLRVCGVVPSAGEPGGGPFHVRHDDGTTSLQIVESAQVDLGDPGQSALWNASTHFNPVDLVLALRDADGRPFELERFVDESAAFVAEKSEGGRALRVYERPGLWNGAMAHWETVFVEVPDWTFAPVKTLLDLARPEHRTAGPR